MEENMRVTIGQVRDLYNGETITIYENNGSLKAKAEEGLCILYYDRKGDYEIIAELGLTETTKAFQTNLNNYLASIHTLVEEELAEKKPFYDFLCWFKDLMTSWPKCQ